MKQAALTAAVLVATIAALTWISRSNKSLPTPTHVAAQFFDGENHGDFRASCSLIQPSVVKRLWQSIDHCETYFTMAFAQAAFAGQTGDYKVIPHSYRGWREGRVEVATVRASYYGQTITVRLVKTAAGWRVHSVS